MVDFVRSPEDAGIIRPSVLPLTGDIGINNSFTLSQSAAGFDQQFEGALSSLLSSQVHHNLLATSEFEFQADNQARTTNQVNTAILASQVTFGVGTFTPQEMIIRQEMRDLGAANFDIDDDKRNTLLAHFGTPKFKKGEENRLFANAVYGGAFTDYVVSDKYLASGISHNVNLFSGMDTNMFKAGDKESSEVFSKLPEFADIHRRSLSPRSVLEQLMPGFFKENADTVRDIMHRPVPSGLDTAQELFGDEVDAETASLVKSVEDAYTDNDIDTFVVKPNAHDIITGGFWKDFSSKDTFAFMNHAYEAVSRFQNVAREVFGKLSDLPKLSADEEIPDLDEPATTERQIRLRHEEDVIKARIDAWWNKVSPQMDEGMLSTFGMFGSLSQMMLNAMDWGHWNHNAAGAEQFRSKMVGGYMDELTSNFKAKFEGDKTLTIDDIALSSPQLNADVFDDLIKRGYIDESGKISASFNPFEDTLNLGVELTGNQREKLMSVLQKNSVGSLSFLNQNRAKVNGKDIYDFKLKSHDGQYRSLYDVMGLVGEGTAPREKVQNAKLAYDYFMNMHRAMTGLDARGSGGGLDIVSDNPDGTVVVSVGQDAQWREWVIEAAPDSRTQDDAPVAYWGDKTGPGTITFASIAEAEAFKEQTRQMIALLEPLVSVFGRSLDGPQINMLVDNSTSSEFHGLLEEGEQGYNLQEDQFIDPNFLNSKMFHRVSRHLETKVVFETINKTSSQHFSNYMTKEKWERDWEEYDEKVEKHFRDEITRLREHFKRQAKLKKEREEFEVRAKKAREEREAEQKRNEKASQDRSKAQRNRDRGRA